MPETKVAKRNLLVTLARVHAMADSEGKDPASYHVVYDSDSTGPGFNVNCNKITGREPFF